MEGANIFTYTGNPFVDAGVSALTAWCDKKYPEEVTIDDLELIIDKVIDLYTSEGWRKVLFSVFPNSAVTNPSVKNKSEKLKINYTELLKQIKPLGEKGTCMACGKRDADMSLTKTDVPLTGSGSLRNFFSYGLGGADYCSACILAIQFSPLVYYSCGKMILLHSNSWQIMRKWALQCKRVVNQDGCLNENYTNPRNSLFKIAEKLTEDNTEKLEKDEVSLRIYHFTNYNQGPDLDIYDFPMIVFRFINLVQRTGLLREWRHVVQRGYRVKGNEEVDDANEETHKNNMNIIYNRLIEEQPITQFFIDTHKKKAICRWKLLELYMKEVRKMEKERLTVIKRVADEIADVIYEKDSMKRITGIENARRFNDFLRELLFIVKDRLALGRKEPLFTLDELEESLFPDERIDWREVQYLILFRIYEKLHDWIASKKSPDEIEEEIENLEKIEEVV